MKVNDYYTNKLEYRPSKARINKILTLLGEFQGKKILDLGCGNGALSLLLKESGATVHAADLSKKVVETLSQKLDRAFVFDADNGDFNLLEKNYDFIIASELIEHLFSPEVFLSNLKKIMAPNSRLIITTPNFLVWTNRLRMFWGKFEYSERGFFDESHIHFFSYNSLKSSVLRAGFKIEREEHIFHPKIPVWLAKLRPNLFIYQIILKLS